MQGMEESLKKLEEWIKHHIPAAQKNLRPGAPDAEISATEQKLGISFPDELKYLYQWHDGEENNYPPSIFSDYFWFLPLEVILQYADSMSEFLVETTEADYSKWKADIEDTIISVKGPVKPLIASRDRIPFLDSNGDVQICIDLDPAPGGEVGQIVEVYNEGCSYQVLAPSLADYLADYVERLYSDYYMIEEDAILSPEDMIENTTEWGLPDYLKSLEYQYVNEDDISDPVDVNALNTDDEVILVGEMGGLSFSVGVYSFTITVNSGKQYHCIATTADTKGASSIAVNQFAKIRAVKYRQDMSVMAEFENHFGKVNADFYVLEYQMMKTR